MAETIQSLDQLSSLKPAAPEQIHYVQKLDKQGRAYATGKRKNAVARVWIKPGTGKVTVNERTIEVFFARPVLRMMIRQPLAPNFFTVAWPMPRLAPVSTKVRVLPCRGAFMG